MMRHWWLSVGTPIVRLGQISYFNDRTTAKACLVYTYKGDSSLLFLEFFCNCVMASSAHYAGELMQAPLIGSFFSLLWVLVVLQPGAKGLNAVQILRDQLCADLFLLPDLPRWQHIFEPPGKYTLYIITTVAGELSVLCQVAVIWYISSNCSHLMHPLLISAPGSLRLYKVDSRYLSIIPILYKDSVTFLCSLIIVGMLHYLPASLSSG